MFRAFSFTFICFFSLLVLPSLPASAAYDMRQVGSGQVGPVSAHVPCVDRVACLTTPQVYANTARRYVCEIAINERTNKPLLDCFWSVAGFRADPPTRRRCARNSICRD